VNKSTVNEQQALELLAEVFAEPIGNLKLGTKRMELSGWDSMGALMFMAMLDEKFGVELTADESLKMEKVEDAIAFMRARGIIAAP
jgi:acyl carrier protein